MCGCTFLFIYPHHAQLLVYSDLGSLDGWTFAQKLLGVTTHYKLHRWGLIV